jgi:hypothetical protein
VNNRYVLPSLHAGLRFELKTICMQGIVSNTHVRCASHGRFCLHHDDGAFAGTAKSDFYWAARGAFTVKPDQGTIAANSKVFMHPFMHPPDPTASIF